jgi:hypothetical protein
VYSAHRPKANSQVAAPRSAMSSDVSGDKFAFAHGFIARKGQWHHVDSGLVAIEESHVLRIALLREKVHAFRLGSLYQSADDGAAGKCIAKAEMVVNEPAWCHQK